MERLALIVGLAALLVSACDADATVGTSGAGGSGGAPNPHHALAMHPEPVMVGTGGALSAGSGGLGAIVRSDRAPTCPPSSQPQLPECTGDWWITVQFSDSELVPGASYELAPDGFFRGLIFFSGLPDGESRCVYFGGIGFSGGRVEIVAVDESSVTLRFIDSANDEALAVPLDGTYRVSICN